MSSDCTNDFCFGGCSRCCSDVGITRKGLTYYYNPKSPTSPLGIETPFLASEEVINKTMSVSGDSGSDVPQMKLIYFKEPVEFTQMEADTLGMTVSYGKHSLGIILSEDNSEELAKLVKKNKTENPIRSNGMLYLKEKNITEKMKEEILFKGPMTVKVKFCATGVCENLDTDTKYLMFKILGLKKVSDNSSFLIQDDF